MNSTIRICSQASLFAIRHTKTALSTYAKPESSQYSVVNKQKSNLRYKNAGWIEAAVTGSDLLDATRANRYLMRAMFQATKHAIKLGQLAVPQSEWSLGLQEARNKIDAFSLFEYVDLELELDPRLELPLIKAVQRVQTLEPYCSVWAEEGIGYSYANLHLLRSKPIRALLRDEDLRCLPPNSLVALHAGIGLSLAESFLNRIATLNSSQDIKQIGEFLSLCGDIFSPQYLGIMYEALGMATRMLYPHLVSRMQRCLSCLSPELPEYFWHGVGRSLYFSPSTFSPHQAAPWKSFQICINESPHATSKRNAVAGFAWAITLVNIRQPYILAAFLQYHGSDVDHDALFNGICSALMIWNKSAPTDDYQRRLRQYKPEQTNIAASRMWNRYVLPACDEALNINAKEQNNNIGNLFRFQSIGPRMVGRPATRYADESYYD